MIAVIRELRSNLRQHPSPEDVASVVRITPFAAIISACNALLLTVATWESQGGDALAAWLGGTLCCCLYILRRSLKARGVRVKRVSSRAARRVQLTSFLLALPWMIIVIMIFASGGLFDKLMVLQVCAGMLAGAALMLQRTLAAALVFTSTVCVGVIAGCIISGDPKTAFTALFAVWFAAFLTYSAFLAGETARERDRMLLRLTESNSRLEGANLKISEFAYSDPVTGLPNRKAFNERIVGELVDAAGMGPRRAMLLFDLDNFKNINDSHGHPVGDELLSLVGERIQNVLGGEGMAARLGGDEFAVIVPLGGLHADEAALAAALIEAIVQPATIDGRLIAPGTSIGIALAPDHSLVSGTLMSKADAALRHAKAEGKGKWSTYDSALGQTVRDADALAFELSAALDGADLSVAYQPKIDLVTGHVCGAEALLRWTHPTLGPIPPDRFLQAAGEKAMMHRVTEYLLTQVGRDILGWRAAGINPGRVAINVHPVDLRDSDTLVKMLRDLTRTGVGPDALSLEITADSLLGRGTEGVALVLDGLADMGFRISLDDFGNGPSAMARLRLLSVDEIKVGPCFVSGVSSNGSDRAVVEASVVLARGMNMTPVAVGVETAEQLSLLRDLGVEQGQGYHWCKPVGADEFAAFMTEKAEQVPPTKDLPIRPIAGLS